jgi:hypothetical protein
LPLWASVVAEELLATASQDPENTTRPSQHSLQFDWNPGSRKQNFRQGSKWQRDATTTNCPKRTTDVVETDGSFYAGDALPVRGSPS